MAGSTHFKVTHTCPSCRETVVHECGKGAAPRAEGLDALFYQVSNALTNALYLRSMNRPDAKGIERGIRDLIEEVETARAALSRPSDDPEEGQG